jgi:hypothetical protein
MRSALKLMYWCVVFACAIEIRKSTLLTPHSPVVTVYTVRAALTDRFLITEESVYCAVLTEYLLTPWSRVLLEKLTGLQLVKKFPAFYGIRRFITAFTGARHLSLS